MTLENDDQHQPLINGRNHSGGGYDTVDLDPETDDDKWEKDDRKHSLSHIYAPYSTLVAKSEQAASSEKLREYYSKQKALLDGYRLAAQCYDGLSKQDRQFLQRLMGDVENGVGHRNKIDREREEERKTRMAIISSNVCNVMILIVQFLVVFTTGSLAFLACLVDAVLDLTSGLVVLFAWSMRKVSNKYAYPVGKSRLGPLAILGTACLMTAATLIAIEEAIRSLIGGMGGSGEARQIVLTPVVCGAVLSVLMVKLCLYFYCMNATDLGVQALAVDHLNDVMSNSVSLIMLLLSQYVVWWLDPVGGLVISVLIIRNWTKITLEHCNNLLGKSADTHLLSVVTFMAMNHHPLVEKVDTVRAYHVGDNVFVEVDVVLNEDMKLGQAHDIGESLQKRIEAFDGVERAFVHLDTEFDHNPHEEHTQPG